mgnify:FL=1
MSQYQLNFDGLPNEIKATIFQMNKDEDKHKQLLHKCLREMTLLSGICIEYSNFITKCVGWSVWEHFTDYVYWIHLENDDNEGGVFLNEITSPTYILKKEHIIKYMIKMYRYEYLDSLLITMHRQEYLDSLL